METKMNLMMKKVTLIMRILMKMKNIKYFNISMKNIKKILRISLKIKDKFWNKSWRIYLIRIMKWMMMIYLTMKECKLKVI